MDSDRFDEVVIDIRAELERAEKWGKKFASLHEAYAVLEEEMAELFEHVRTKKPLRNREQIHKELIQIAAMAIKSIGSEERFVNDEISA